MADLVALTKKNFPPVIAFKKLIGPSFIILGVGLGSGELILWPYLSSNYGMGLIWAALLGITFQFFINMEIERYTLATGESIFVGLRRKYGKSSPYWFMATTLIPWLWPGIIASAGVVIAQAVGFAYTKYVGIFLLIILGVLFSLGSVVYKTQEKIQKAIILIGVPFVFIITLYFLRLEGVNSLLRGLIGRGDNFWFIPKGTFPIATFLAALAYAGAGGNLNLAQSLYIKEKGYGMAKFSGRITNVLANANEKIQLEGSTFDENTTNVANFTAWWKRINLEHGIVFLATGAFTMVLLSLLAYSTVYKAAGNETSINFVIGEAQTIAGKTFPIVGKIFLLMCGLMLFGTQFSVYGSNARIATENLVIADKNKFSATHMPKFFYAFLWLQILSGILIFALGFTEPLTLVVTGAVLNAFSMFIYTGLILRLNITHLPPSARPNLVRKFVVTLAFLFYGGFSLFTLFQNLAKF